MWTFSNFLKATVQVGVIINWTLDVVGFQDTSLSCFISQLPSSLVAKAHRPLARHPPSPSHWENKSAKRRS